MKYLILYRIPFNIEYISVKGCNDCYMVISMAGVLIQMHIFF
jgi:hypothetical protein